MLDSITEFVTTCKTLDNDGIYDLFECECSDRLRDEIYALADPDSPEPFRNAMLQLGFADY